MLKMPQEMLNPFTLSRDRKRISKGLFYIRILSCGGMALLIQGLEGIYPDAENFGQYWINSCYILNDYRIIIINI